MAERESRDEVERERGPLVLADGTRVRWVLDMHKTHKRETVAGRSVLVRGLRVTLSEYRQTKADAVTGFWSALWQPFGPEETIETAAPGSWRRDVVWTPCERATRRLQEQTRTAGYAAALPLVARRREILAARDLIPAAPSVLG